MTRKDGSKRPQGSDDKEISCIMKEVGRLDDIVDEEITEQVQHTYKSPMRHRDIREIVKVPEHQIKLPEEYELEKLSSKHVWKTLPDSVNGTLLYFLLVEQNTEEFNVGEFFQLIFLAGLPVYLSFYFQIILIYWVMEVTPPLLNSAFCTTDTLLQHAIIAVFLIFLYPSVTDIYVETYVTLRCTQVAMIHEEEDTENPRIALLQILAPMSKRLTIFFITQFIESFVLLFMVIVGSLFILSSEDVSDLIINSVALAFIMDIDNQAKDFFQPDTITEHLEKIHFETKMQANDNKLSTLEDFQDDDDDDEESEKKKCVDPNVVATFWNIDKLVYVIAVGAVYLIGIKSMYCENTWLW